MFEVLEGGLNREGGLLERGGLFQKSRSRIYLHGDQGCHEQLVGHLPIDLLFQELTLHHGLH